MLDNHLLHIAVNRPNKSVQKYTNRLRFLPHYRREGDHISDAITTGLFSAQRVDTLFRSPFWDGISLDNNLREKKTIGSPDGFPFISILENIPLNILAKPTKETYEMGQFPIVVGRKYGISIIISPLVVNMKMFFLEKDSLWIGSYAIFIN
jgi:hypothetical protein